jgi:hypothetical protein
LGKALLYSFKSHNIGKYILLDVRFSFCGYGDCLHQLCTDSNCLYLFFALCRKLQMVGKFICRLVWHGVLRFLVFDLLLFRQGRFLSSMFLELTFQLNIIGFVPFVLYFAYSFLIALTVAIITGTIGFFASYSFLCRIYR